MLFRIAWRFFNRYLKDCRDLVRGQRKCQITKKHLEGILGWLYNKYLGGMERG